MPQKELEKQDIKRIEDALKRYAEISEKVRPYVPRRRLEQIPTAGRWESDSVLMRLSQHE